MGKFLRGLDIEVPISHDDPDNYFDELPMPYSMIANILEVKSVNNNIIITVAKTAVERFSHFFFITYVINSLIF